MPSGVVELIVQFALIPAAITTVFVAILMAILWRFLVSKRLSVVAIFAAFLVSFLVLFSAYSITIYTGIEWILWAGYAITGVVWGGVGAIKNGLKKGFLLAISGAIFCYLIDSFLTTNLLFE